ncbi:MAG: META domain-containing protein [Bacteroidota bacterium]
MNNSTTIISCLFFLTLLCCTPTTTYWVGSIKADCEGVSPTKCLQVSRSETLADANWENFYSSIEGFEFEEGYLQKIEVKERKLNPQNVPADGSSIEYKLVKVLEKKKDEQITLDRKWVATMIRGEKLGNMDQLPTLLIDQAEMRISGNSSCNRYSANITWLSGRKMTIDRIGSTKRMCSNMSVEQAFTTALSEVTHFKIEGKELMLYNENDAIVLRFQSAASEKTMQALHDIWTTIRIDGNPINRMVKTPTLEINLNQMRIMGNDGCNEYSADIQEVSEQKLIVSMMASTKKACLDKNVAPAYYAAWDKVVSYRRDGLNLMLLDENGEEVLAFFKVD